MAQQSVVYVNHAATGNNDGSSWANAFTDIAMALQNNHNHQFWIAQGIYIPINSIGGSFNLSGRQTLLGGFDGTETMASQRDPVNNVTILSGDLGMNDLKIPADTITDIMGENSAPILQVISFGVRIFP